MSFNGIGCLAPQHPVVRAALCAYCGRPALADVHGNCLGCGAPQVVPAEVFIDVTNLASTDREYVRVPQPQPLKK